MNDHTTGDTASENLLSEHVAENRSYWDGMASQWVESGERNWELNEPVWGIWELPEAEVRMLPEDMSGIQAIELGCGTGYVSAWMARRGAQVTGIDNSAEQLATARRLALEHRVDLTLMHGNAETVSRPDASFDFAVSEYGAAIWCDPYAWIPEAYRLLKPGGRLVFLGTHPLAIVCTPPNGDPADRHLHEPWFGMHRQDWRQADVDPGGIEFNLPPSDWFRLFRDTGFEVEDYLELRAPADMTEDRFYIPCEWAKSWPSEQVWKLRKI